MTTRSTAGLRTPPAQRRSVLDDHGEGGNETPSNHHSPLLLQTAQAAKNLNQDLLVTRLLNRAQLSKPLLLHRVEKWNDQDTRGVRITQKELNVIGGQKIVTKVEVLHRGPPPPSVDEQPPPDTPTNDNVSQPADFHAVFSVKHTTSGIWRKQLQVHKNLLLACILAGVPCPIEMPEDSLKVFNSVENPQHVHIYLERVIQHFRFRSLPRSVTVFWWRAVGNGSLIFQNWETGRLLILPCKKRGIPAAADTLQKALTMVGNMPSNFWEEDTDFGHINLAATEEAIANGEHTFISMENMAEIVQSWALEDGVSPWMTKLIVKSHGQRRGQILQYRYSIGVEFTSGISYEAEEDSVTGAENPVTSNQMFIAIQVHCNEPLSRELKAYPVCMVPAMVDTTDYEGLTVRYLRSLWFLRKLYEYHSSCEVEREKNPRKSIGRASGLASTLRPRDDQKDLSIRRKLIGGARLLDPKSAATMRSKAGSPRIGFPTTPPAKTVESVEVAHQSLAGFEEDAQDQILSQLGVEAENRLKTRPNFSR